MKDRDRTREQLISELTGLRQQVAELEMAEVERAQRAEEQEAALLLLQATIDEVDDPILLIGADYQVQVMNRAVRDRYPVEHGAEPLYCYQVSHYRDTPCSGAAHPCPLVQVRKSLRPVTVMHEHVRRDGEKRLIEIIASPLLGEDGALTGIVELTRDVTEHVRMEETLQESEERFRTLARLAPAGIYLTDTQGDCQYVNERWCGMAGLTLEEALGDGWVKGIHPDDRERVASAWYKMVESRGHWGLEYRFQTSTGETTWVFGLATILYDSLGQITGYVGVNMDITERKRAEEALREAELSQARKDAQQRLDEEKAEQERLRQELLHQMVLAQEEERRHIARELHDEASQAMTALSWRLAVVKQALPKSHSEDHSEVYGRIRELQQLTEQVMNNLRQLTTRLRPAVLDELGLVAALITYADDCSDRYPFVVDVCVTGQRRRLPSQIETTLYRITQEALTNVAKHAHASHVSILLHFDEQEVILNVSDDGVGMNGATAWRAAATGKGWGLAGIAERVQLVEGNLDIRSASGDGTDLIVRVPVSRSLALKEDTHKPDPPTDGE